MWSVWSETADIYFGQGFAMFKAGSAASMVTYHDAALPLARVLPMLNEQAEGNIRKGSRLRIYLSAAICPALGFTAPQEVTQWQERQQIARAAAAQTLGTGIEQLACEIDAIHPGVAAAVSVATIEELHQVAAELGSRLVSIQPLWSVVTQCPAVRHPNIKSAVLLEPDALTLLASDGQNGLHASTLPGQIDLATLLTHARRWQVGHSLTDNQVIKIGFGVKAKTVMPEGPRHWPAHWYQP